MEDVTQIEAERSSGQPLSVQFAGTMRARRGEALEMLTTPVELRDWCRSEAGVPCGSATAQQLEDGLILREAIYRSAAAASVGRISTADDRRIINEWAARDRSTLSLTDHGTHRSLPERPDVETALALVATSAVELLGDPRAGSVKVCAADDCGCVFLDSSRGRTRRWCSMNICGNRAKKAALRTRAAHKKA